MAIQILKYQQARSKASRHLEDHLNRQLYYLLELDLAKYSVIIPHRHPSLNGDKLACDDQVNKTRLLESVRT